MRKYLWIIAAALLMVGCGKKPAEQSTETQEQQTAGPVDQDTIEQDIASNLYSDITGVTPGGEELSLSELIGQTDYVLVDFWASWCNPCRRYIPVLKEIYATQPAGRLQILSCSVDQDQMAWRVALQEEKMPWPQVREDANHVCSDLYGVEYIPYTVLIDRDGHIVAFNPEEPEIENILFSE